jgi:uncharacterized membrane protein YdjX (TVP38/TMEM64 family)
MQRLLEWLAASQHYFQELGWIGIAAYALVIVIAQMLLVPLSPFAFAAGVFFGFGGGFAAVTLGTGMGAAVNFLISRHVARAALTQRLGPNEKFRIIDAAIAREGWKIVALLRFCPLPYGLANYCYGLTAIRFWPYWIATLLAIIPVNMVLPWIGATAQEGLGALTGQGRARQPIEYVLLGVGIVAAMGALVYVGKVASAALAKGERKGALPPLQT